MAELMDGMDKILEALVTLYEADVIVEVYYYEADPCELDPNHPGNYSAQTLVTRMLATLDDAEVVFNKRRSKDGRISDIPQLILTFDAVETTDGMLSTQITLPLEYGDAVVGSWTTNGGLDIDTPGSWSCRITPTREPVRHSVHELVDEHNRRQHEDY